MIHKSKNKKGKVFIAGAGPGDPGLITINAFEKLKTADVVVYDRLINEELLSFCDNKCEKIFVGKESGYHAIEQDKITEILIQKAKSGLNVVRLKGGNPFVFGRGSEEAIQLKKAGIQFEIIPGITSGLSAPIYSGIPITQRNLITQCIFITAHECPEKKDSQVDWKSLAKLKNTSLIIYMGASRIESITEMLIKYGIDPSTPVAVIENATLPIQRTITERIDKIAEKFREQNFHAPVIIMVSPTVAFRNSIAWYEEKPLFNKKVIVAGAKEHFDKLKNIICDLGAEAIPLEIMKIKPFNTKVNISKIFYSKNPEWILFSCNNSVKYFEKLLKKQNFDARLFGGRKVAVIGSNSAKALASLGLNADFILENFNVNKFKRNFINKFNLTSRKVLTIFGESLDENITNNIKNLGLLAQSIKVFETLSLKPAKKVLIRLEQSNPDIFIFTCQTSIEYFFEKFNSVKAIKLLNSCESILVEPLNRISLVGKNIQEEKILTDSKIDFYQDIFSKLK